MEILSVVTYLVHQIGITLGVGASTFALTFYIASLEDGEMDQSEKRFLHVVYVFLRIAMVFITLVLLTLGVVWFFQGNTVGLKQPSFLMESTIMLVIIANAVLMTIHKMPMWLGPVLAGGSWYSMFFVSALPFLSGSYLIFLLYYIVFLGAFFACFCLIKRYFSSSKA